MKREFKYIQQDTENISSSVKKWRMSKDSSQADKSSRSSRESISTVDTPILIVDDNRQYTDVLSKMLSGGFGYTNITISDELEEAYEIVKQNPDKFGLLFVDYNFPSGGTGGEFLLKLQAENLLEGKIAFLITSDPTIENVNEARKAGALGVVAKPFDRYELTKQLEKAERAIRSLGVDSF